MFCSIICLTNEIIHQWIEQFQLLLLGPPQHQLAFLTCASWCLGTCHFGEFGWMWSTANGMSFGWVLDVFFDEFAECWLLMGGNDHTQKQPEQIWKVRWKLWWLRINTCLFGIMVGVKNWDSPTCHHRRIELYARWSNLWVSVVFFFSLKHLCSG